MSKDKPEVGDVFINIHCPSFRMYVLGKSGTPNTYEVLGSDGTHVGNYIDCSFVGDNYKYLGKSKASIEELFDVRD